MRGIDRIATRSRKFGSRLCTKEPNREKTNLDHNTCNGIFIEYIATTKNIYYIDDITSIVTIEVHALFDKVHFTAPQLKIPLAAQTSQSL